MNLTHLFFVGIGGMLGSMGRYSVGKMMGDRISSIMPYSTLIVNILGSFIIGVVISLAARKTVSTEWSLFLSVGVCGGFTTFSAFSIENIHLLQQKPLLSLLYISISVAGGICSAAIGLWLGKSF